MTDVESVDVNPLIVSPDGVPIAVDALVELRDRAAADGGAAAAAQTPTPAQFKALFEPRGVLVAGASSHPGKFGFVVDAQPAGRRLRGSGLRQQPPARGRARTSKRSPTRRSSRTTRSTSSSCARRHRPTSRLLRACAAKGATRRVRHVRRLRRSGRARASRPRPSSSPSATSSGSCSPARTARASSARPSSCAPRWSPRTRRPGASASPARAATSSPASSTSLARIGRRGQPGRLGRATPPPSASPTTSTTTPTTTTTAVGLAYVEGIGDGRALIDRFGQAAARKPLVLVKGGATEGGARAAASHTGALAADDKVFDGACRAVGITRAATIEEAFEAAATFATQPPPPGPNVVVLTTAGGWGVVTADAITRDPDLAAARRCPTTSATPSTSCCRRAGAATTRSTAPAARPVTRSRTCSACSPHHDVGPRRRLPRARHPVEPGADDARRPLLPGLRAGADRRLPRAPGRPVRRGRRRAQPGDGQADPHRDRAGRSPIPTTPGPAAVRASGRLCYPSGNRAVTALGHLYRDARYRARRGG